MGYLMVGAGVFHGAAGIIAGNHQQFIVGLGFLVWVVLTGTGAGDQQAA